VQTLYNLFNVGSRNDLRDKLEERGVL